MTATKSPLRRITTHDVLSVILAAVALSAAPCRLGAQPSSASHAGEDPAAPAHWIAAGPLFSDGSINPCHRADQSARETPEQAFRRIPPPDAGLVPRPRPASAPVYVYPLCDATPDGVGLLYTYSWQALGSATLAHFSGATQLPVLHTETVGVYPYEQELPLDGRTIQAWLARARQHRELGESARLLTGICTGPNAAGDIRLELFFSDGKAADAAPRKLLDVTAGRWGDAGGFIRGQREIAKRAVEVLVAEGLVPPASEAPQLPREKMLVELGHIIELANTMDTYAASYAVNRALVLAECFPRETAPLQAAAYSWEVLTTPEWARSLRSPVMSSYHHRRYALAQAGRMIDPGPAALLYQLLTGINAMPLPVAGIRKAAPPARLPGPYRRLDGDTSAAPTDTLLAALPPTLRILCLPGLKSKEWKLHEAHVMDLAGQSAQRDLLVPVAAEAAEEVINSFPDIAALAGRITLQALTSECALRLIWEAEKAAADGASTGAFLAALGGIDPELPVAEVAEVARRGDYYTLVRGLQSRWTTWAKWPDASHSPRWSWLEMPETPAAKIMALLETSSASVLQDSEALRPRTGFAGLEVTRAEALLLLRRRAPMGILIFAQFLRDRFGSYEMNRHLDAVYGDIFESNANYCGRFGSHHAFRPLHEGADERYLTLAYRAHVLAPCEMERLERLCRAAVYANRPNEVALLVREILRRHAMSNGRNREAGMILADFSLNALAVKYLDAYLREYPEHMYSKWLRARCQIEMGQVEGHTDLLEQYYVQNPSEESQRVQMEYLIDTIKDMKTAEHDARMFLTGWDMDSPWLFRIRLAEGKVDEAERLVDEMNPGNKSGLGLARFHAERGERYIQVKAMEKARAEIAKAAAIDSYQGNVITAMGKLRAAEGDHDGALKEYQRSLERYGPSNESVRSIAVELCALGKRDNAILLLEDFLRRNHASCVTAPDLMRLYAEIGTPARAKADYLMNHVVGKIWRDRKTLVTTIEAYKSIDTQKASAVEARVDDIMAGPRTLEELSRLPVSGAFNPPR